MKTVLSSFTNFKSKETAKTILLYSRYSVNEEVSRWMDGTEFWHETRSYFYCDRASFGHAFRIILEPAIEKKTV